MICIDKPRTIACKHLTSALGCAAGQAGQVSAALATFAKLKTAGGGVGAGGLRVLGQLAKANLSETTPNLKAVADLEAQLPSVASLSDEEVDRLETSVPGMWVTVLWAIVVWLLLCSSPAHCRTLAAALTIDSRAAADCPAHLAYPMASCTASVAHI